MGHSVTCLWLCSWVALSFSYLSAVNGFAPKVNSLPDVLFKPPVPVDLSVDGIPPLPPPEELQRLRTLPRALVGYISRKRWAFTEFVCMAHASWSHLISLDHGRQKLDLLVFVDPAWAPTVGQLCPLVDLDAAPGEPGSYAAVLKKESQCVGVVYDVPPERLWYAYPYINNVHFFADPRVADILRTHYGYVMKTDFDVFFAPPLLDHFPDKFEFGVQEYVLLKSTSQRLQAIGTRLGLPHKNRHNIGPTWYGPVDTLLAIGNLSIPVLYHILFKEFEQRPEGGIKQDYMSGENWPDWNAGIAALYATEILVNGMMNEDEYITTAKYDEHGESAGPTDGVYHIHCRHGDGDFSKFEFLEHHYDKVTDLFQLDTQVIRNYAMVLAVKTWRELMKITRGAAKEL